MTTKYSSAQSLLFFFSFEKMGLTSTSVGLERFQLLSAENKMNSSNNSAGKRLYKIESNSTCIHVKQLPIFPQGWCSKDCQVGSVVLYFPPSLFSCFISFIRSKFSWLWSQHFFEQIKSFSFSIVHGFL